MSVLAHLRTLGVQMEDLMISSAELSAVTGLSYREVDYWTRRGVLRPNHDRKGSGTQRRWSEGEARFAEVARHLRDLGTNLDIIARVGVTMRQWDDDEWHGAVFITSDGTVSRNPRSLAHYVDLDVVLDNRVPA